MPIKTHVKFLFSLVISITLLFFIFRYVGLQTIYKELLNVNFYYIALSISLVIFSMLIIAIKWINIIKIFNTSISVNSSLKYTFISFAFGLVTPARFGELIKIKYLKNKAKLGYIKSFLTVVIDKTFDIITAILLILIGLIYFKINTISKYLIVALIFYVMSLILTFSFFDKMKQLIYNMLPKKYRIYFKSLKIVKSIYIKSLVYSILIWFVYVVQAFLILIALKIPPPPFYIILVVVPLMALSSLLPISIGGLGTRELISIYLLAFINIPPEKSTLFSLFYTFIGLGIPAIVGGILYILKGLKSTT